MFSGRRRQVTEPVDRIYGDLGLSIEDKRNTIPIDYS